MVCVIRPVFVSITETNFTQSVICALYLPSYVRLIFANGLRGMIMLLCLHRIDKVAASDNVRTWGEPVFVLWCHLLSNSVDGSAISRWGRGLGAWTV